jgi:uncharacterized damage-inducible protein DinB
MSRFALVVSSRRSLGSLGTRMARHTAGVLGTAALLSVPVGAQELSSAAIAGRWTGRVGPGANPSYALTLDLHVRDSIVSGTVTGLDQAGEIRRGRYNSATGALYLELGVAGQPGAQLSLDGILVDGTAIGRVTKAGGTGTFILRRADASPTGVERGDLASISREQLKGAFDEISANISKAAALVPADKYAYQPVSTVRTFGQLVGHVIDAAEYYCGQSTGRGAAWSDSTALGRADQARLIAHLDAATASCRAATATGSVGPLIVNVAHANLHYGNMVTYMRLLGLVPPSSR